MLSQSDIHLSFVITTIGRPTVNRMIRSLVTQLQKGDELLVIGDAPALNVIYQHFTIRVPFMRSVFHKPGGDWGNKERNFILDEKYSWGTHVIFGDDDDAFLPGAVTRIVDAIRKTPENPIMFRMVDPNGVLVWKTPRLLEANVGTPMFVFPNRPDHIGRFSKRYEGDFDFMTSTMKLYPKGVDDLVWSRDITYGCRAFGNLPDPGKVAITEP